MDYYSDCPHSASSIGSSQFTAEPVLFFLREAIADELGAIVGYLECANLAKDYRISEQFRQVADDETCHFLRLMGMLANLDPLQAEEFRKTSLLSVLSRSETTVPLGMGIPAQCQTCNQPERRRRDNGDKRPYVVDELVMECLRNSIQDELRAINAYQKYISELTNPMIQNLLIQIMNKEKEHFGEFVKIFYAIYLE